MKSAKKKAQSQMVHKNVTIYANLRHKYTLYAETLVKIFDQASKKYAPQAIVQARPKAIASFAEKILRKNKYTDPTKQITDLCGARVITHMPDEVRKISEFIEKNFVIDWENSVDVSKRLKPTEFGYRSVHYIIQFKDNVFPNKEVPVEIPKELFELKAEVQVRTILEHSWADFSHDMSYKGAFKIPDNWKRELSGLAALLESADNTFSRIHNGLQAFAGSYAYMAKQQMQNEMDLQEFILGVDPKNVDVAYRIGQLAIVMGDWQKAIDVLSKYVNSNSLLLKRDLGVALCKKHKGNKKSPEYLQGQEYLEIASAPPNKDIDALSSLASSYKEIDEEKTREYYSRAFEIDPTNPYCIGNYLESEIVHRKDASIAPMLSSTIVAAMKRSREQIEVGINLPWAFYDLGKFYLLTGKPMLSLSAYAKGVQISLNSWMIENALHSINRLSVVRHQLPGYEWVRKLLLIALAARFQTTDCGIAALEEIRKLKSPECKPIQVGPIIIVAGACEPEIENQMQTYQDLIFEAFRDFKGTIISGGTTSGISGLIGDVQLKYASMIRTIGYLPKENKSALIDKRYSEIRFTESDIFSPSEPLQYWIDLVTSQIESCKVKLLGIDGGSIAAIEYQIALALDARVALVQGSGREVTNLLLDIDWKTSEKLSSLPNEGLTAWAFVEWGNQTLEPTTREKIAKLIHESYRSEQLRKKQSEEPSITEWPKLIEDLKESNRQQADHIFKKLSRIGCATRLVKDRKVSLMTFTVDEVEILSEMEHARWNVERLQDGWKLGDKDAAKKISPYIVPWSKLPENAKEWDRKTVRKIPEFLAQINVEVYRLQ